jgi:Fe2+ or Zn2+ uptake regulation protein
MGTLQDALMEILHQSSAFKSARELQKCLLEQTSSRYRLNSICRALGSLEKFGLVELHKELGPGGRGGCCYFWHIKDSGQ